MTFGSLFAGIGGFDLGLERAGMECRWQVEIDSRCNKVLARHWPKVERFQDVKVATPTRPDVIAGGDPCPHHSHARSNGESKHPDLSGYFLALVGRLCPWWVVRENVPSPSADVFSAVLEHLGYGTVIVELDATNITGQSRCREFTVGRHQVERQRVAEIFQNHTNGEGSHAKGASSGPFAACLTTHPCRYDSRDNFVWNESDGLRILDGDERETIAGFPRGWTAGFSEGARAKFYGNSVVPQVAEWIGRRIVEYENTNILTGSPQQAYSVQEGGGLRIHRAEIAESQGECFLTLPGVSES